MRTPPLLTLARAPILHEPVACVAGTLHRSPHHLALLGAAAVVNTAVLLTRPGPCASQARAGSRAQNPPPPRPEPNWHSTQPTKNSSQNSENPQGGFSLNSMGGVQPQTTGQAGLPTGGHLRQFCCGPSSLLSPQSLTPLHSFLCPMQRPFQHRNWSEAHWGLPRKRGRERKRGRGRWEGESGHSRAGLGSTRSRSLSFCRLSCRQTRFKVGGSGAQGRK